MDAVLDEHADSAPLPNGLMWLALCVYIYICGNPLGPQYILHSYMDPLGKLSCFRSSKAAREQSLLGNYEARFLCRRGIM